MLVGLLLFGRWFSGANPTKMIKIIKFLLLGVIGSAAIFFIFTGKLAWAFFVVPLLAPWLMRARTVHRAYRNFSKSDYATGKGEGSGSVAPISEIQAFEILGLNEGATEKQIKDAHRHLIAGIHPDHGGSTYLAAQINQAKDILLRK